MVRTIPSLVETRASLPQETPATNPNASRWDSYYQAFSVDEKKQFINNQVQSISLMMQKHMRKMKESQKKMREN